MDDEQEHPRSGRVRPVVRSDEVASLHLLGWTHRTSPLGVLEQVAVPRSHRADLLHRLRDAGHPEAVVLSTCNRTEVYLRLRHGGAPDPLDALAAHHDVSPGSLRPGLVRTGAGVPGTCSTSPRVWTPGSWARSRSVSRSGRRCTTRTS